LVRRTLSPDLLVKFPVDVLAHVIDVPRWSAILSLMRLNAAFVRRTPADAAQTIKSANTAGAVNTKKIIHLDF
jgi:hypothetical protein